jgi:hypothetical protein
VRLEELGQLKNSATSSGIEPANPLVAYGKNNLVAFTAAERFNFDEFISGRLHEKDLELRNHLNIRLKT